MDSVSMQKIAQLTGVSKSTVSCALNFRGGVDSKTMLTIHQLAKTLGYMPSTPGEAPFCAAVLPENPQYYWHIAYESLSRVLRKNGISVRLALYPSLNDPDLFFSALDTLLALSPHVLVLSAPVRPEVKERLQSIAEKIPIFLLSEQMEAKNVFYFGSDKQRDGIVLAEAFRAAFPLRNRMLVLDSVQSKERDNSFLSACRGVEAVCHIRVPAWHSGSAAILARRIASEVTDSFDCVYCGTGKLPTVCLALDKLGVPRDVVCIGYENPPSSARFWESGRIGLTLCQDIKRQGELCAKSVVYLYERSCFPNQKYNYVDSRVISTPE